MTSGSKPGNADTMTLTASALDDTAVTVCAEARQCCARELARIGLIFDQQHANRGQRAWRRHSRPLLPTRATDMFGSRAVTRGQSTTGRNRTTGRWD
jgi:hypothetical protein